jgi:hypothetical protein
MSGETSKIYQVTVETDFKTGRVIHESWKTQEGCFFRHTAQLLESGIKTREN